MTTPKSVWIIEQGEYSDYRVVGVFSSRENAQAMLDRMEKVGWNDPTIAEWPLDPGVAELNQGMALYHVVMDRNGVTEKVSRSEISGYTITAGLHEWRREEAGAYRDNPQITNALMGFVWATDDRHAVKIVNEKRIQLLATGQWKGKRT